MKTRFAAVALALCLVPVLAAAQRGAGGNAPGGSGRATPPAGQPTAAPSATTHPAGTAHAAPAIPVIVRTPGAQHSAPVVVPSGTGVVRGLVAQRGGPGATAGSTPFSPAAPGGFISTGGHGVGNINHPGGVLPSGFQPLPTVMQPLPMGMQPLPTGGPLDRTERGSRDHRNTNVLVYPIPVFMGGYGYYAYDSGLYPESSAPNVMDVQPDQPNSPQPESQQYYGPSRFVPQPAPDQSDQPASAQVVLTLLVFKDHSIYAATDYWRQDDRLHYLTNYGSKNSIPLDQLDMDMTVQLNRERNVPFILVERKP